MELYEFATSHLSNWPGALRRYVKLSLEGEMIGWNVIFTKPQIKV